MNAVLLVSSLRMATPQLQAGAETSNITPEIGTIIVGGFAPYPALHVHDELHARCLVLDERKLDSYQRFVARRVTDGVRRAAIRPMRNRA